MQFTHTIYANNADYKRSLHNIGVYGNGLVVV